MNVGLRIYEERKIDHAILAVTRYVIWPETYDRLFNDVLVIQDDIAGKVTTALRASIGAGPDHQEPGQ